MLDADFPLLGGLYAFLIIIVGQFFLLNLILAVIIQAFINIQRKDLESKLVKLGSMKNCDPVSTPTSIMQRLLSIKVKQ